jgi:ribosomal protein S18 acetylase RimI-like enzyme
VEIEIDGLDHGDRIADVHPLDNPIWHALTGPQAGFAEGKGRVYRYRTDVAPFAALPDEPEADDWESLSALLGADGLAVMARPSGALPSGWERLFQLDAAQMIVDAAVDPPDAQFDPLGDDDVPDMLDLVERTRPGPFLPRTVELGGYVGRRDEHGRLIAMAGERLRLPGYTEVSAVCTDPAARGRGLASALVRMVASTIQRRGEVAMLHAATNNTDALRLYEHLGFTTRTTLAFCAVRPRRESP